MIQRLIVCIHRRSNFGFVGGLSGICDLMINYLCNKSFDLTCAYHIITHNGLCICALFEILDS